MSVMTCQTSMVLSMGGDQWCHSSREDESLKHRFRCTKVWYISIHPTVPSISWRKIWVDVVESCTAKLSWPAKEHQWHLIPCWKIVTRG
jgi:hypothetical protein